MRNRLSKKKTEKRQLKVIIKPLSKSKNPLHKIATNSGPNSNTAKILNRILEKARRSKDWNLSLEKKLLLAEIGKKLIQAEIKGKNATLTKRERELLMNLG